MNDPFLGGGVFHQFVPHMGHERNHMRAESDVFQRRWAR